MIVRLRIVIAAACIAWPFGATAQVLDVSPSLIYEGQRVAFATFLGACPFGAEVDQIETSGRRITVRYRFQPRPTGCSYGPVSMRFQAELGPYPPGDYELRLEAIPDDSQPILTKTFTVLPLPAAPAYANLRFVTGDRSIVTHVPQDPQGYLPIPTPLDVAVRATDASGEPVAGVQIAFTYAWYYDSFVKIDEFGFPGFNVPRSDPAVGPIGSHLDLFLAVTDANGVAGTKMFASPGTYVVGAGHWPGTGAARQAFANVVTFAAPPSGPPVVAVEYHHATLGRYVMTANDDEIAALDRGAFAGWERSTGALAVWKARLPVIHDSVPVCRFFSPVHTSHFYTIDKAECDGLAARWPGVWVLETREAFWVMAVSPSGLCPTGTQPVYRMYRASPGPSHRYVTGKELRDAMIAAGWIFEGSTANDRGLMCVPA